jgi:hypothetical protein
VVGDVHGRRDVLVRLLRDAGLLDHREGWSGADARLWLLGDLVDRGPDGVGVIELVMGLERSAPVRCLLGNHEAMLLAASRFGARPSVEAGGSFLANWLWNGGQERDLARLTADHVAWISGLPAVAREGDWLLLHADTDRYLRLGQAVEQACDGARAILGSDDPAAFATLLDVLFSRNGFHRFEAVDNVLAAFGGSRIVHGHTPIAFLLGVPPTTVTEPLVYGGGRVVNADHCLYDGGPGFVIRLDQL